MDALSVVLRVVRESIEASGAPPDALQDVLREVEHKLCSRLGGGMHYFSRVQQVPTKVRIIELAEQGLTSTEISERLGISYRWARKVVSLLRFPEGKLDD